MELASMPEFRLSKERTVVIGGIGRQQKINKMLSSQGIEEISEYKFEHAD
jgi:tetraacyldisaccharide-1-P 4'-kinase